jgi:excisionase family DNA binding protein
VDEKIYTTEQVAEILQIHPLTVLKYIKNGKLKGVKLGRVYRIRESALQVFLEQEST